MMEEDEASLHGVILAAALTATARVSPKQIILDWCNYAEWLQNPIEKRLHDVFCNFLVSHLLVEYAYLSLAFMNIIP